MPSSFFTQTTYLYWAPTMSRDSIMSKTSSQPPQSFWSCGETVKFPNVRLQFLWERGSDLPKITLGVRARCGLEPKAVWAPCNVAWVQQGGTSGCLPSTVWGHDTHPGGEDELYWPVPAWIWGTSIHGPPTFQAVSVPWNWGGWKARPCHPCRVGRASWDLLGEPLRVPQDCLKKVA